MVGTLGKWNAAGRVGNQVTENHYDVYYISGHLNVLMDTFTDEDKAYQYVWDAAASTQGNGKGIGKLILVRAVERETGLIVTSRRVGIDS